MINFTIEFTVLNHHRNCSQVDLFLIHYNGWSQKWDEWIPETRILKYNDANLKVNTFQRNGWIQFLFWQFFTSSIRSAFNFPRISETIRTTETLSKEPEPREKENEDVGYCRVGGCIRSQGQ